MWPFKIKFDFGKESLGAKLEEWTIKFASELGFVIYGVGGGYYSIFFLDEGERDAVLERKYSDGKEDIYYHDVIPFEHKRFKNRLRYRLMKWHRMVPLNSEGKKGWPSWLPSKLYYDLVSAIALAQKRGDGDRGNYMTFADIYQFMSECFAYDRVKRAEGEELPTKTVADRLYKMVQEIYEAREELGFFVRKRITNPVTYEIVMLDISDKGDEMWPDSEGIPEDDDRCDEFEFLLPSQK
jgi:hypothetical protein